MIRSPSQAAVCRAFSRSSDGRRTIGPGRVGDGRIEAALCGWSGGAGQDRAARGVAEKPSAISDLRDVRRRFAHDEFAQVIADAEKAARRRLSR